MIVSVRPGPTANNTLQTLVAYMDTHYLNARPLSGVADLAWLTIEREGTDSGDTYTGSVYAVNLTASYVKVFDGGHHTTF